MSDRESDKKATFAKDISRALTQFETTFKALEAMASKRGCIPPPAFAIEMQKDHEGRHFSFSMEVSKPRAWLTPFLHWADCNAPQLAGKTREHLDRLLEYGMKADDVLRNPPTDEALCDGAAGTAVSDWFTFWAHLQTAADFLRELQPAVERHTGPVSPDTARAIIAEAARQKNCADRDAPHAKRGRKVLAAVSEGGRERVKQHYAPKIAAALVAFDEFRRKNPKVSISAARCRVAPQHSISAKTLERHDVARRKK